MVKKCIYCKSVIEDNSVVDVCQRCGVEVWGEKMFSAIVKNMEKAREEGDLYQGINANLDDDTKKQLLRDASFTREMRKGSENFPKGFLRK